MPGVIDDITDFLAGSKALKKAAGTDTSKDCPNCGGTGMVGISQSDIAKDAQAAADRAKAAKQATPKAPAKAAPKKKASIGIGDMMDGYA